MKIVSALGDPLLHRERAVQLELEQRDVALGRDPVELREERPRPLAPREHVVLEEVAVGEPPVELLVAEEPVVHAVPLARPACARRRRDGEPEPRDAGQQRLHHRPLAGARGAGEDEDRSSTG